MTGKVTLVGAGPGDPGLITVKGKVALLNADVVVFDRLVGPDLLNLIPSGTEKVDVGKASSRHTVPQEEINQILLDRALAGKNVVRLKGGDPFLFGRGGEELELLAEHGVPFAVVPGVTSAIAVPTLGGIPVTHRDVTSSLHIITGHAQAGRALDIDFEALVRTKGTLVFLMGVASLPDICAGLLSAGLPPATPAAIVENGSTPQQRRISATAGTLAAEAVRAQVHSPAVIVVGAVCALAERFDWFSKLPLRGKTIVVTRPKARVGTLSDRLRALGAAVLEYPCVETVPILPCPAAAHALDHLTEYEWLAFTSPAGADVFWDLLERHALDARALCPVKIAALGPGTALALKKYGLRADFVPNVYDAAHLGEGLAARATGRVLLLRAEQGAPALTAALDKAGVAWADIATYRSICETPQTGALRALAQAGGIDAVTFTSASTVRGFVACVGKDFDFSKITGVCIGAQSAAEAEKYAIKTVVAKKATIDDLIAGIEEEI